MNRPLHMKGSTTHARKGGIDNAFRYGVDFVMIDPEETAGPAVFSRNRFNLYAVHDRLHGGERKKGRGVAWAREVFEGAGLETCNIRLLTQPSFLGHNFNPVSFWMAFRGTALVAVIAEVNNTFGDRHSYLCHLPGFAPLKGNDRIEAKKIFHVSPFQDIAGTYVFHFDVTRSKVAIRIQHDNGEEGLIATLVGSLKPASSASLIGAAIRRPFGTMRVVALIYWQALKLKFKGARYRTRPVPPTEEISGC